MSGLPHIASDELEMVNLILSRMEKAIETKVAPHLREETWDELQQVWFKVNGKPETEVELDIIMKNRAKMANHWASLENIFEHADAMRRNPDPMTFSMMAGFGRKPE